LGSLGADFCADGLVRAESLKFKKRMVSSSIVGLFDGELGDVRRL
jgi:hypothetical protein